MHHDRKIERWEEEYVYKYIRVAHHPFGNFELPHGHRVVQVAFRAEVPPVLVEVLPFLAPPACLWILCCVILARERDVHLILTHHCRVSVYRSLHCLGARIPNSPHFLMSECGMRYLDQELRLLNRGAQKPTFGHVVLM